MPDRSEEENEMKTTNYFGLIMLILAAVFYLSACSTPTSIAAAGDPDETQSTSSEASETIYTLKTIASSGKLLYEGVGGEIDGVINPDLIAQQGGTIRIVLLNGDAMQHDVYFPDFNAKSDYVTKFGDKTEITFDVGDLQPGNYVYYCTVPGHRRAGQEGKLVIIGLE